MQTNKSGIDFIINSKSKKILIEVKTDTQSSITGNIFIETVSNDKTGAIGWLHKSRADYVAYLVGEYFLLIDLPKLRGFILNNGGNLRERSCNNDGYK